MLTIGKVARDAQVNVETIRFYEREGIIDQPPDPPSGYRIYPEDTSQRIRFIKHAQSLGFSLKEIRELLDLKVSSDATCHDVKESASLKLKEIELKIKQLKRMKTELSKLISSCSGTGPTTACPILAALEDVPLRRTQQ